MKSLSNPSARIVAIPGKEIGTEVVEVTLKVLQQVDSLLRDSKSYAVLPYGNIEIVFGKWSGASNFQYLFEKQLQNPQPRSQYEKMRDTIKSLANKQKRYLTANEVLELWKDGIFE